MKRSRIIFIVFSLCCMTACSSPVKGTEVSGSKESFTGEIKITEDNSASDIFENVAEATTIKESDFVESKEYTQNLYEFPLVCLDFNGNYIDIPEIRWYIWLQEDSGATPLSIQSLPLNTEELQGILKNCIAEVIKVPKELSPLYGMTISCIKGAAYYGEDKENYYYCGTYPSVLRLSEPTKEHVVNSKVIRTLSEEWPFAKKQETYIHTISKDVVRYESNINSVADDPYNLYAVRYYMNEPSDYRATIKDGNWVECVQDARDELLNDPEKYKYPEEVVAALYTKNGLADNVVLCDTAESEIIDARAQIYAWYKIQGSDSSINDIIVLSGTYDDKEERLIFAWNCLEEEWFTNYSKNFYVDITSSLKYYAEYFREQ